MLRTGPWSAIALALLLIGAPGTARAQAQAQAQSTRRESRPAPSLAEQLTKAKDPLLRETAALVLGDGGERAALPLLTACLRNDDNRWVRAACAEALGRLGDPAGVPPLTQAIEREKHPRVRRAVAQALLRLGQRGGVDELMWQLQTGAQHDQAEAMHALVHSFGRALGQDPQPWWEFFAQQGYQSLPARAAGAPSLRELGGLRGADGRRWGPWLNDPTPPTHPTPERWRQVCATVLRIDPATRLGVGAPELRALERRQGPAPSGCLLLISTGWQEAPRPTRGPTRGPLPHQSSKLPPAAPQAPREAAPTLVAGPGLTEGAVRWLLARDPGLLGIGIDAPRLDLPSLAGDPALELLRAARKLVVTGLDGLRQLPQQRFRVLLVPGQALADGERPVLLLAITP